MRGVQDSNTMLFLSNSQHFEFETDLKLYEVPEVTATQYRVATPQNDVLASMRQSALTSDLEEAVPAPCEQRVGAAHAPRGARFSRDACF